MTEEERDPTSDYKPLCACMHVFMCTIDCDQMYKLYFHFFQVYLHNNKLNDLDQQTFYGMDRLKILDLRHNNLSTIHDETFKFLGNLTTLLLSNNSLKMSDFFYLFRSLESLQNLDLGFNLIEEMNVTSFQPLVSLASLSIRRNRMRVVPVGLFQHLEKLAEVDISGNPFDCDCDLLPLQEWLRKTKIKILQRYDLNLTNTCVSPPEHKGKQVTAYTVERFQCNVKMLYMIIFGSVGGLGIVVGIISSLVCHYYNKWRKTQRGEADAYRWKRKKDSSNQKENNRVDLVRVSKRSDPYGKQELVNGWVASKRLTVANKIPDNHSHKKHHQGPPRPPWPERLTGRSKRDEKSPKEKPKKDSRHSRRDSSDRRIHSISEMVPLRPSQQHARHDRARSLVPAWDDRYHEKYPPALVNLKRTPDRWEDVTSYPTWNPPPVMRSAYHRDAGRYYTLPYPVLWPRYPPYGPDYPYRRRFPEEELSRPSQSRALPYPPRNPELNDGDPRPLNGHRSDQHPNHNSYPATPHRDHESQWGNREERGRNERGEGARSRIERDEVMRSRIERDEAMRSRNERDERTYPDVSRDHRHDRRESNDGRQAEGRHGDHIGSRETEGRDGSEQRYMAEQNGPMRRGTSEVQIHKRDSEYRNAMDNPIGPKAVSSPLLAEDKASDWL